MTLVALDADLEKRSIVERGRGLAWLVGTDENDSTEVDAAFTVLMCRRGPDSFERPEPIAL